eukprot:scpid85688/ scgid10271/ 
MAEPVITKHELVELLKDQRSSNTTKGQGEIWLMHLSIENRNSNMARWIRKHVLPSPVRGIDWRFIRGDGAAPTEEHNQPQQANTPNEGNMAEEEVADGPVPQAAQNVDDGGGQRRRKQQPMPDLYVGHFENVQQVRDERSRIYKILTNLNDDARPKLLPGADPAHPQYPLMIMARAECYDDEFLELEKQFRLDAKKFRDSHKNVAPPAQPSSLFSGRLRACVFLATTVLIVFIAFLLQLHVRQ